MIHQPFGRDTITFLVFKVSKFILNVHLVSCLFTIGYNVWVCAVAGIGGLKNGAKRNV